MTRRALPLLIALLPTAAVAQPAVVLGVFVEATAKGDPRTKNLWSM